MDQHKMINYHVLTHMTFHLPTRDVVIHWVSAIVWGGGLVFAMTFEDLKSVAALIVAITGLIGLYRKDTQTKGRDRSISELWDEAVKAKSVAEDTTRKAQEIKIAADAAKLAADTARVHAEATEAKANTRISELEHELSLLRHSQVQTKNDVAITKQEVVETKQKVDDLAKANLPSLGGQTN